GINEDATNNPGQTVASFRGVGLLDPDAGALQGIAITATSSSNGTWQYSLDGTNWTPIGAVTGATALLLRAGDLIRFAPNGENGGSDTLTYRAWDQTSGAAGGTADTSTNGGTTAFSTTTNTATLTVSDVNDAPVLAAASPSLTGINEDATNNPGQTVASF